MDDFVEDYAAFELFQEAHCDETEIDCPECGQELLFDPQRAIYLCPDCRSEFQESDG